MTRARKHVGRITFVGAGPGDPGLLTAAAVDVLCKADICFVGTRIPSGVLDLIAGEVRSADAVAAEAAKALLVEARAGFNVVRLVAGDPLGEDAVVKELQAIARTAVPFDIVPGLSLG